MRFIFVAAVFVMANAPAMGQQYSYESDPRSYHNRPENYPANPNSYHNRPENYPADPRSYHNRPENYPADPRSYHNRSENYPNLGRAPRGTVPANAFGIGFYFNNGMWLRYDGVNYYDSEGRRLTNLGGGAYRDGSGRFFYPSTSNFSRQAPLKSTPATRPVAARDSDADGVPDSHDRCKTSPRGANVWRYGKWIGCSGGEVPDR